MRKMPSFSSRISRFPSYAPRPVQNKTNKGRSVARYPWDEWFSKEKFTLVKGVHFECEVRGMLQMLRNRSSARGLSLQLSIEGDKISVIVYKRAERPLAFTGRVGRPKNLHEEELE